MPGVLQNSALRERVSDFVLHREMELNPNSGEASQSDRLSRDTHLGYDDFFFKNFHGVVFAAGLLSDKNHLPKSSLSQKLQVVKVAHCLEEKSRNLEPATDIISLYLNILSQESFLYMATGIMDE